MSRRGAAMLQADSPTTIAAAPAVAQSANRLLGIGHSPDSSTRVVGDEQRAVGKHQQSHDPTPAGAIGELPSGHEVLTRYRLAVLDSHPDHLVPGRHRAVPRTVERD